MVRRVVLVCGPPGAGKTTLAKSLGLKVYYIDDPQWGNSETNRDHRSKVQIAAVKTWWTKYEPDALDSVTIAPGVTIRDW